MKEKVNKGEKLTVSRGRNVQKIMAILAVLLSTAAVIFTKMYESTVMQWQDSNGSVGNDMFVYENLGISLLLATTIVMIVIKSLQRNDYWIHLIRTKFAPKLDERQLGMRQRVYAKSYIVLVLLMFVGVMTFNDQAITQYVWLGSIWALSIPSVVAALGKDN